MSEGGSDRLKNLQEAIAAAQAAHSMAEAAEGQLYMIEEFLEVLVVKLAQNGVSATDIEVVMSEASVCRMEQKAAYVRMLDLWRKLEAIA